MARDCPQRKERVSSIVTEGQREEAPRLNPIQLLNAITHEKPKSSGLLYVQVTLNGHKVRAMVDTGATHTFISDKCIARFGLSLVKGQSRIKAVNSEAKPVVGMAKDVALVLGEWKGKVSLAAISLDDYDVILGLEWLSSAQVIVAPHLREVIIAGSPSPCFVRGVAAPDKRDSVERVSALQLVNGPGKGEETFMAFLMEEATLIEEGTLMKESEMVYGDAMCMVREEEEFCVESSPQCSKGLPPRRHIDQAIELECEARPPTPKLKAPSELTEQGKRLREKLDEPARKRPHNGFR